MAITLLMWGSLPVQLKILIARIDPVTLTWYRFTGALLLLGIVAGRSCLSDLRQGWSRRTWILLLVCGLGLTLNYLTYLRGLDYLTPSTAQILMQIVPFMVLGGGILIFGEPFAKRQWWGVLFLFIGSVLFFNQKLDQIFTAESLLFGIGFIFVSACSWTAFLLSQKALLPVLRSRTIMICCYITGFLILGPQATVETITQLETLFVVLVVSTSLIAVAGYLMFATALRHVPTTTGGLTIANIPLVTLFFMLLFGGTVEHLAAENLNTTALLGAVVVVGGTVLGALGPSKKETK